LNPSVVTIQPVTVTLRVDRSSRGIHKGKFRQLTRKFESAPFAPFSETGWYMTRIVHLTGGNNIKYFQQREQFDFSNQ
jgi:hypothetical protein